MPIDFSSDKDVSRNMRERSALPLSMSSAMWSHVDSELKNIAFFSAKISDAKMLETMQGYVADYLAGKRFKNAADFVATMRTSMGADPKDWKDSSDVTDIRTNRRLKLIFDTNVAMATSAIDASRKANPDFEWAFPYRELYRAADAKMPRGWERIFPAAGGLVREGRFLAPRNHPVWTAISDFGNPYPPFKFGSKMRTKDVSRSEVRRLGLPLDSAPIEEKPAEKTKRDFDISDGTTATLPKQQDLAERVIADLRAKFGDGLAVQGTAAALVGWRGKRAAEAYDTAADESFRPVAATGISEPTSQLLAGGFGSISPTDTIYYNFKGSPRELAKITPHILAKPGAVVRLKDGRLAAVRKFAGVSRVVILSRINGNLVATPLQEDKKNVS